MPTGLSEPTGVLHFNLSPARQFAVGVNLPDAELPGRTLAERSQQLRRLTRRRGETPICPARRDAYRAVRTYRAASLLLLARNATRCRRRPTGLSEPTGVLHFNLSPARQLAVGVDLQDAESLPGCFLKIKRAGGAVFIPFVVLL